MSHFARVRSARSGWLAVTSALFAVVSLASPTGGDNLLNHTFAVTGTGPSKSHTHGLTIDGQDEINGTAQFSGGNFFFLTTGGQNYPGTWHNNHHRDATTHSEASAQVVVQGALVSGHATVQKFSFKKAAAYNAFFGGIHQVKLKIRDAGSTLRTKGMAICGGVQTS